jgi:hypothetical protein
VSDTSPRGIDTSTGQAADRHRPGPPAVPATWPFAPELWRHAQEQATARDEWIREYMPGLYLTWHPDGRLTRTGVEREIGGWAPPRGGILLALLVSFVVAVVAPVLGAPFPLTLVGAALPSIAYAFAAARSVRHLPAEVAAEMVPVHIDLLAACQLHPVRTPEITDRWLRGHQQLWDAAAATASTSQREEALATLREIRDDALRAAPKGSGRRTVQVPTTSGELRRRLDRRARPRRGSHPHR